jgi:hypothetical protein
MHRMSSSVTVVEHSALVAIVVPALFDDDIEGSPKAVERRGDKGARLSLPAGNVPRHRIALLPPAPTISRATAIAVSGHRCSLTTTLCAFPQAKRLGNAFAKSRIRPPRARLDVTCRRGAIPPAIPCCSTTVLEHGEFRAAPQNPFSRPCPNASSQPNG